MHRNREDIAVICRRRDDLWLYLNRRNARQRLRLGRLRGKDCCGAVPMMHVAVYRHCMMNSPELLHLSNGDGDVVSHAKALTVIGISEANSAAYVEANPIGQRRTSR